MPSRPKREPPLLESTVESTAPRLRPRTLTCPSRTPAPRPSSPAARRSTLATCRPPLATRRLSLPHLSLDVPASSRLIRPSCSFTEAVFPIFSADGASEELRRLQMGCMDCFGRALCTHFTREFGPARGGSAEPTAVEAAAGQAAVGDVAETRQTRPLIVELTPEPAEAPEIDQPPRAATLLLPQVLQLATTAKGGPCALNILIIAAQQLPLLAGVPAVAELAASAIPALIRREGADTLQVLFTLAYHSQPHTPPGCIYALMQRALVDARSKEAGVRLAALKLLGAALSSATSTEAWGPNPDEMVQQVVRQLSGMQGIDESAEVRRLALKLSQTAFAMAGA